MGVTNFPRGVSSFGLPLIGNGLIPATSGNYYFVSSTTTGSSNNNAGTWDSPLATVAGAIAKTTASNGDVIVMMPYHAENISAAGTWTPLAGTTIVGLGWGGARPKIAFSATTGTILCSSANVVFQNFIVYPSIAEVVTMFAVQAADIVINSVDYQEVTALATISFITTTAAGNRLVVMNCRHISATASTGTAAWITIVGGDGITIANNYINIAKPNNAAAAGIGCITTLTSNIQIANNYISVNGGTSNLGITLFASSTGLVAYNSVASIKTSPRGAIALANAFGIQNYTTNTVNTSGILDPIVTTT